MLNLRAINAYYYYYYSFVKGGHAILQGAGRIDYREGCIPFSLRSSHMQGREKKWWGEWREWGKRRERACYKDRHFFFSFLAISATAGRRKILIG